MVDTLAAKDFAGKKITDLKQIGKFATEDDRYHKEMRDHTEQFWEIKKKLADEIFQRTKMKTWRDVKCRQLAYLATMGEDKSPEKWEQIPNYDSKEEETKEGRWFKDIVEKEFDNLAEEKVYPTLRPLIGAWFIKDEYVFARQDGDCAAGSLAFYGEQTGGGLTDLHAFVKGGDGAWYCAWRSWEERQTAEGAVETKCMKWLCRAKPGTVDSKKDCNFWKFGAFLKPKYDNYGDPKHANLLIQMNLDKVNLEKPIVGDEEDELVRKNLLNPEMGRFHWDGASSFAEGFYTVKQKFKAQLGWDKIMGTLHSLEVAYFFSRAQDSSNGPKNMGALKSLPEHTANMIKKSEEMMRKDVHPGVKQKQVEWWLKNGYVLPTQEKPWEKKKEVYQEVTKAKMAVALYMRWGPGGGIADPHASFMTENNWWWAKWGYAGTSGLEQFGGKTDLAWISNVKAADIEAQKTVADYEFVTFLIAAKSKFIIESMRGYEDDRRDYGGHTYEPHDDEDRTTHTKYADDCEVYEDDDDEAILKRFRNHKVAREHVQLRRERRLLSAQLQDLRDQMASMIGNLRTSRKSRRSRK